MSSDAGAHSHLFHRDDYGKKMGMWLFLFTEVLLFGGLFIVYAVYRFKNHEAFHAGSAELSMIVGAINTVILLTSSFSDWKACVAFLVRLRQSSLETVKKPLILL